LNSSTGNALSDSGAVSLANTAGVQLTISASETIGSLQGGGTTGGNVSIASGQTLTVQETGTNTFSGRIIGAGSLTKTGSGTMSLSGTNTYTGTTTVNGGTLTLNNGSAIADTGAVVLANTSGVQVNVTGNETIGSLQGGGGTGGTVSISASRTLTVNETSANTFSGVISGSGRFTKNGSGTLILEGSNSYTGVTTLNTGTLRFSSIANGGVASAIGQSSNSSANLVLNGGTLDYTGSTASTDRGFTVSSNSSINVGSGVSLNFSGSTTGGGTLTKAGLGTLEFSGSSVGHTSTTVSAGSLLVSGSLGGTIRVGNGGTLLGAGTIGGLTTLNSGANLTPGNGVGTMTFQNGLTLNAGSTVTMNIAGAVDGSADRINVSSGSLTRGGTVVLSFDSSLPDAYSDFTRTYDLFSGSGTGNFTQVQLGGLYAGSLTQAGSLWTQNNGNGYVFTFDQSTGDLTVIPEPSTWALLSFGAAFVVWRVRRRVCIVESSGAGRDNCSGGLRPPVGGTISAVIDRRYRNAGGCGIVEHRHPPVNAVLHGG
jgi:autotransporter-associated beta strand protein